MSSTDEAPIVCPYCGEETDIHVDTGMGTQDYVEDCTVCCRPIVLHVERDEDGFPSVSARRESE